jgi:NADPH-dependent FMN reductase
MEACQCSGFCRNRTLATPEYTYSIPGVLKNAIDWASRPYGDSAWEGKPVTVMGVAGGHWAQRVPSTLLLFGALNPTRLFKHDLPCSDEARLGLRLTARPAPTLEPWSQAYL